MSNTNASCRRPDIGGQAVMEGVMMKAPDAIAISVRRPNGDIITKRQTYVPASKKHKWMGWPLIRGMVNMVLMLSMGMKTLDDSAKMGGAMEEEPTKFELWLAKKLGKGVDKVVMGMAIVLAVCLSMGLFVFLPNTIVKLFPADASAGMLLLKNLATGILRTAILLGYLYLCGRIPDMNRTFRYHGAEHKTVYCHEAGLELTPKNARPFTTLHPRCGTSFMLITFILSIVFYSIFDVLVLALTGFNLGDYYFLRVITRLLLLPLVAGISYEVLKLLAHKENKCTVALRKPGMMLQKLSTAEPDDSMLEVAIIAMKAALGDMPEGPKTEEGYIIAVPAPEKSEKKED